MKTLIQRVSRGSVSVEGRPAAGIGRGLVVLLGIKTGDTVDDARQLAHKTVNLRIFPDGADKMNLSVIDIEGELLVISQFTLYADTRKGNRPSFIEAAHPEIAEALYDEYVRALRATLGEDRVITGTFRTSMSVEIINDGPVTIELTTDHK